MLKLKTVTNPEQIHVLDASIHREVYNEFCQRFKSIPQNLLMFQDGLLLKEMGHAQATELNLRELKGPVVMLHFLTGQNTLPLSVGVQKGEAAQVMHFVVGEGSIDFKGTLRPNSELKHFLMPLKQDKALELNFHYALERDARLTHLTQFVQGPNTDHHIVVDLKEPGAHAHLLGAGLQGGDSRVSNTIAMNHLAPHTESGQLYKNILAGEARAHFEGKVYVAKHAVGVNSEQLNKNLLLSKKAHAHTRPQLEILCDDVKCAHGATVGELEPEELFYLESRGIPPKRARALQAQGFMEDLLEEMKEFSQKDPVQFAPLSDLFMEALKAGVEELI